MKWTPGGSDQDIDDRRGMSGGGGSFGGMGGRGLGLGGLLIIGILSLLTGRNLFQFVGGGSGGAVPQQQVNGPRPPVQQSAKETRAAEFTKFVLNNAQTTWDKILPEQTGRPYRHATLTMFRDVVNTACGGAQAATGPFYCPGDEHVYVDLAFFDELANRFGAPGDFANAYVIAHELGHHVQKILGIEGKVRQLQQSNPSARNQLSVRMELQADCLAGVWGHYAGQNGILEEGDVEAGLRAAAAVGDDHIQKMTRGRVSPESFTHGSSAERMQWFRAGLASGKVSSCNTFGASGSSSRSSVSY
jgi:predicted metalloprotease